MKRSGYSMIEVMIYLLIFSLILLLFSRQVSSLIKCHTAGRSVTKQQADVSDIMSILSGEIQNMGLKVYKTASGLSTAPNVFVSFMDSEDSSSFIHGQGIPNDTLTIYKAEFDNTGNFTNVVDTVSYYVDVNKSLIRDFKATGGANAVGVLAGNVQALQFSYGTDVDNTVWLNQGTLTPGSWNLNPAGTAPAPVGTAPTKTTGTSNVLLSFTSASLTKAYLQYSTALFVTVNQKYLINVTATIGGNFPTKLDSLCFSFRKSNGSVVGWEKFLPQKNGSQFFITVQWTGDVYATIDYCTHNTGDVNLKGVVVTCVATGNYTWTNNPATAADKQNVKAIKIQMVTKSDREAGIKNSGSLVAGDATVATTDNYTYRKFEEIVECPNNYTFGVSSGPCASLTDLKIRATLVSVQF
jgi:hypothetical protein